SRTLGLHADACSRLDVGKSSGAATFSIPRSLREPDRDHSSFGGTHLHLLARAGFDGSRDALTALLRPRRSSDEEGGNEDDGNRVLAHDAPRLSPDTDPHQHQARGEPRITWAVNQIRRTSGGGSARWGSPCESRSRRPCKAPTAKGL